MQICNAVFMSADICDIVISINKDEHTRHSKNKHTSQWLMSTIAIVHVACKIGKLSYCNFYIHHTPE